MRKFSFTEGETYHVYNRGVDKRPIFSNREDLYRFFLSMQEFNVLEPIGSIYKKSFSKDKQKVEKEKLVEFIAYCLNPNHYHFVLKQVSGRGIEKFMQRLGTGYTNYFNEKESRSGALFQGRFKANHIASNEYLLHASAYVNLNFKIHHLKKNGLYRSSWNEYTTKNPMSICTKNIILEQFKSIEKYKNFAEDSIAGTLTRRRDVVLELENIKQNNNLETELLSLLKI